MCGIAGIRVKKAYIGSDKFPVEDMVDYLLLGIEHRGKDATGLVSVTDKNEVTMEKDDVTASLFYRLRNWMPDDVRTILLHTRFATQGEPKFMENNHPVNFGSCFAVHNGHISNDKYIVQDVMDSQGLDKRPAEVDSIAIPMLIDQMGFDNAEEALKKLYGNCATAVIDPVKNPGELIVARVDSSPLFVLDHKFALIWASTEDAILRAWAAAIGTPPDRKKVRMIKEGMIIRVNDDDEVVESRFKEERTYGYASQGGWRNTSHGDWWYGGDNDDYESVANRPSTTDLMCFECGKTKASTTMKDDTTSNGAVFWFTPICWPCKHATNGDASKLTYKHCKNDQLKLFFKGSEQDSNKVQTCDLCTYYDARVFTDAGMFCNDCHKFREDNLTKATSSINETTIVTDPTNGTTISLKLGDALPQEISVEYKFCEVCEDVPPTVVGPNAQFMCLNCFERSDTGEDIEAFCKSCGTITSVFSVITVDGQEICTTCEDFMFGEKEDDSCGVAIVKQEAVRPLPESSDSLRPWLKLAYDEVGSLTVIPQIVIQVANDAGLPAVFTYWLLYFVNLDYLEDKALYAVFNEVTDAYEARGNRHFLADLIKEA